MATNLHTPDHATVGSDFMRSAFAYLDKTQYDQVVYIQIKARNQIISSKFFACLKPVTRVIYVIMTERSLSC